MTYPIPPQSRRALPPKALPEDALRFVLDAYPKLHGFLCGMGCEACLADEITNDACKAVVERWEQLRAAPEYVDKPPTAYLYMTARRMFWRRGRQEAARLSKLTNIDAIGVDMLPAAMNGTALGLPDGLVEALDQVPAKHREVLLLRLIMGFDTAETAKIMGAKEGSVRYWLSQGRKEVMDLMPTTATFGEPQETSKEATR